SLFRGDQMVTSALSKVGLAFDLRDGRDVRLNLLAQQDLLGVRQLPTGGIQPDRHDALLVVAEARHDLRGVVDAQFTCDLSAVVTVNDRASLGRMKADINKPRSQSLWLTAMRIEQPLLAGQDRPIILTDRADPEFINRKEDDALE